MPLKLLVTIARIASIKSFQELFLYEFDRYTVVWENFKNIVFK